MKRQALVLFAHGARDPRWAAPFERLQQLLQAQLPDRLVALAFLELMTPRLPDLVDRLMEQGCDDVTVVPIFLGQGGHVLRDLPLITEQLRQRHPRLTLRVAAAAGEDAAVLNAIAKYCVDVLPGPAD
ncbi:MAG: cobalamin biosynthesis protein CbiX [Burkholderiales bacterium RIFCSPLOWO2_02_FULL_57_36]|nr:MAG: cobalamin biosynthesis protein CbiX [Burkholderiales bacterium RIFCSPLOWO2_02_FULL_57_36]